MSPNIMHRTQVIISFQGVIAFGITVFFSFDLDMDYIIRYHQCFSSYFTTPLIIPSYSICSSCQGSTCFVHPLAQLVVEPSEIIAWHAFLLFHSWCLSFLPRSGEKGHQEMHTHLHWYMVGDQETLQEEHIIKAQVLASQKSLEMSPNPTPPPLT